ncbi:MAG: alanine racemase, partial [bacterium]|nr:alanine racemase [bacterium]
KFGFSHDGLRRCFDELLSFEHIAVDGLMVMAPLSDNPEDARPVFAKTREYFEELCRRRQMRYLSMGMSQDYRTAIEEGSNMVRIGTSIFRQEI